MKAFDIIRSSLFDAILKEADFKPYLWWRYINDIFFLWKHGEEKLRSFINDIKKNHPTIKFTAEWSKKSMTYMLNLPTDSHQYLLSSSGHPFYCKKGMPYSEALRLNRICSNNKFSHKRCKIRKIPIRQELQWENGT